MIGTQLGPYEILGRIGAGGMGEVLRARDPRVGREVAIKVLPASVAANRDRLARFEQEARAVAALNHPNLVTLHELGTHEGTPYLVMELLEGSSLRELLEGGPIPPRKAIDYAIQIANGLAAAHEKGIVHRDLKPDNVFVTSDGRVKLLDFGLAKLEAPEPTDLTIEHRPTPQTSPGTVLGTVGYMSPEQVRGLPVDPRTDLFSFGALLYEMLSGRRAFEGTTAADTISAILRSDPPDLAAANPNLPPALDRMVRHCLEKNPAERFQSARDLAFDLQHFTDPSSAMRAAAARGVRRRAWIGPALGILLAATAIAFAALWWRERADSQLPSFRRVTFGRGAILNALFTPGGEGFVFGAEWGRERGDIYEGRFDQAERRALGMTDGDVESISPSGELAVVQYGVLARVPLTGGSPRPLAKSVVEAWWLPDGKSLSAMRRYGSELRIEHPLGKVIYRTSDRINARLSRDGTRYALTVQNALFAGASLATLDLRGNVKALSSGWSQINGMAWSPDDEEIWFTASRTGGDRSLWAVDMDGDVRPLARAAGALSIQDVDARGRALVARYERSARVELSTPEGTKDLSWLDFSMLADLSTDGKQVLFTEQGEGGGSTQSVYLRGTDGSPAVRLGEGTALALSPDGAWVATVLPSDPQRLILLPTGAGEPRPLPRVNVQHVIVRWLPDGKRLMVSGPEPGKPFRTWIEDLSGHIRPITPENLWSAVLSADGRYCYSIPQRGVVTMYPVDGGPTKEIRGISDDYFILGASADGRHLFIGPRYRDRTRPTLIERFEIASGKIEPWRELTIADPVGAQPPDISRFSADGTAIAYSFRRFVSDLYLVEGLR